MVQEWGHGNGETLIVKLDIYDDDNRTCDVLIAVSDKKDTIVEYQETRLLGGLFAPECQNSPQHSHHRNIEFSQLVSEHKGSPQEKNTGLFGNFSQTSDP